MRINRSTTISIYRLNSNLEVFKSVQRGSDAEKNFALNSNLEVFKFMSLQICL